MTVRCNELDKRIKDLSDIQSYRQYDDKYIGETGYFSDNIIGFSDLDTCTKSVLASIDEMGGTDMIFDDDENYYRFFLPESLLKEIEYRPFTKDEFMRMFKNGVFGQWITMKNVVAENEYYMQITGCFTSELDIVYVCLGSLHFSLADLFKDFQWKDNNGNWRVFGVEIK
jgi:hypothetical protein